LTVHSAGKAEGTVKFCVGGMKRSSKLRVRNDPGSAQPIEGGVLSDVHVLSGLSPVSPSSLAGMDAAGRIAALGEAFQGPTEADSAVAASDGRWAELAGKIWGQHRRVLKSIVGLLVVVAAGWMPVRALLETSSTEAVINARLITLRAPIEGQIGPLAAVTAGSEVQPGATLVSVVNPRADRGRLDDLRRLVDELESDIKTLAARRTDLAALHKDLVEQTRAFRAARLDQLEARIAELGSDTGAAEAKREEAQQALARARSLEQSGSGTKVSLEKARRDATVAEQALLALGHRRTALDVELAALKNGVYVGDSYNDRPQSLQRADDLVLRLNELGADINHRQARLALLRAELVGERERYAERSAASLASPVRGSVWEIMTAPGESVARGQDLVRLLDCSGLVVTATVGETAYNHLRIGDPARFRFRGESKDFEGRIMGLTGVATAAANLAIQPSALAKEPYRVTVAVPELAKAAQCDVGRTGRVTFGK
jgi:multidrug resistance efflux pump